MIEKSLFCLVGDDDSGPEDALDDLDLECVAYIWFRIKCTLRAHLKPTLNTRNIHVGTLLRPFMDSAAFQL